MPYQTSIILSLFSLCAFPSIVRADAARPNILFLLSDDRRVAVLSTATGCWSRRSREVLLGRQDLPKSATAI